MPHVLAGVESILTLPPPAGGNVQVDGKLPALIAAVWFFVVTRMRGPSQQGVENMVRKTKVREVLAAAREDDLVLRKVGEEEDSWKGWERDIRERDVNDWRKEILRASWKEGDWYRNIDEGAGVDGEMEEIDEEMGKEEERKERKVLRDRYDYLSEANRQEFAQWKSVVFAKIDDLIKGGTLDDSGDETDTRE